MSQKTHKFAIPFEVKAARHMEIEGHGSVFGNVDLGADIMLPGAFTKSLARHTEADTMPAMLWQHRHDQVPGAWESVAEDADGLNLKGRMADTQLGRESHTLAKMKAVSGLSIGGLIDEFDFDKRGNRLIKAFDLWEVSLVTFPMNPRAQIEAVKSQYPDPRSLERHLREAGCSKSIAREVTHDLFASGVIPDAARCDAEDEEMLNAIRSIHDDLLAGIFRTLTRHTP